MWTLSTSSTNLAQGMQGLPGNEENPLATGSPWHPGAWVNRRGLQGGEKDSDLGMILDVSHLNDASFWDLLTLPQALL